MCSDCNACIGFGLATATFTCPRVTLTRRQWQGKQAVGGPLLDGKYFPLNLALTEVRWGEKTGTLSFFLSPSICPNLTDYFGLLHVRNLHFTTERHCARPSTDSCTHRT